MFSSSKGYALGIIFLLIGAVLGFVGGYALFGGSGNQIAGLQNQVAALQNDKTNLQNQVVSLEDQVSNLQSNNSDLQNQVGCLQSYGCYLPESLNVSGTCRNQGEYPITTDWSSNQSHLVYINYIDTFFEGSFVGTMHSQIINYFDPTTNNYASVCIGDFVGAVVDKEGNYVNGTFTFLITAYGAWGGSSDLYFHSNWTITDGTGGHENMTGCGTFTYNNSIDPIHTYYSGIISFG